MADQPDGKPRDVLTRWWRVSLRAKGVAVLAVPMAALFAALFSIYWVEGDVRDADQTVVRAYNLRAELAGLRSSLLDAHTAISGYLATGEKRFLTLYDASRRAIDQTLSRTAAQVSGDAAGSHALAAIQRLTADEAQILDQLRDQAPQGAATEALKNRESTAMAGLQASVALLGESQERLFAKSRYDPDQAPAPLLPPVIVCGLFGPPCPLF